MRKILLLLGICLLCYCYTFAQGMKFDTISLSQGLERARNEGKLVFVDVTASWCEIRFYLYQKLGIIVMRVLFV